MHEKKFGKNCWRSMLYFNARYSENFFTYIKIALYRLHDMFIMLSPALIVTQIQKALWRTLEPLFSRNKKDLRFKRGQRKCACNRGQILPTRNNNYSKSIRLSWPLSVKHAAKITFAQWKCRTFQNIIYPAEEKNYIGISSILAWGKSRVGLPPPFIAREIFSASSTQNDG